MAKNPKKAVPKTSTRKPPSRLKGTVDRAPATPPGPALPAPPPPRATATETVREQTPASAVPVELQRDAPTSVIRPLIRDQADAILIAVRDLAVKADLLRKSVTIKTKNPDPAEADNALLSIGGADEAIGSLLRDLGV